jgi:hypothetical protein
MKARSRIGRPHAAASIRAIRARQKFRGDVRMVTRQRPMSEPPEAGRIVTHFGRDSAIDADLTDLPPRH